ncbi:hypothetical protein NDU88_007638 [Pleurodeles waltl]|uniref:Uncharacterized protein n=1 Tax=Pleurodeles waltl TaxID=8319 RepID=A0AAV7WE76_PLEWA|nr:hypothetical protein NDU88_006568 [Pleurodeles waltl]KAJ1212332.1 hypothetical protein NDU88_007638 [Pleurodeles waltl]
MQFIDDTLHCVRGFPTAYAHLVKRARKLRALTITALSPVWLALTQLRSQPGFFLIVVPASRRSVLKANRTRSEEKLNTALPALEFTDTSSVQPLLRTIRLQYSSPQACKQDN